ncbi:MAG: DEAD/DEAH box helicase family protein [Clostridiaceae bacterium]|nr:DEAD/DEAH box helicase family protein [Clostridiaceae bacterium]
MVNHSGALITNNEVTLGSCLKHAIRKSKKIRIIAAFIRESGIRLILEDLKVAVSMGAKIQILTGLYLGITEPSALYLLRLHFGNSIEIRIFKHNDISFHPKTYIFEDDQNSEIYIGSSNISASALENGVEWNYRIVQNESKEVFSQFYDNFNLLFNEHSVELTDELLKKYSIGWKQSSLLKNELNSSLREKLSDIGLIAEERAKYETNQAKPYGAQIEALYHLERARSEVSKGLVVMATGVGKTYLAAFDSRKYKKILFVAHREEILNQACQVFSKVMPDKTFGMFKSSVTEKDADVIFASVQTLGKPKYLNDNWFKPDHFQYVIIDEFHHVAAQRYKAIVDYFRPEFLLGLTATPFRMDKKDIYSYCDDNVIYELNLKEAIERGYLVPFNYYGIYDDTDYSRISYRNGKYDEKELEDALSKPKRAELVLKYFRRYKKSKAIAFCCSIKHANVMTEAFISAGIPAASVHTGEGPYTEDRKTAVQKLVNGELSILFVVDIFNEGVDVPEIDTVLFLRPTESYTVFLQQLGRGLRKCENKDVTIVLDFVGNYKLAPVLPVLLSGENPMAAERRAFYEYTYPEGCNVQFDMKLIDLFEEMAKNDKRPERLRNEYFRLKHSVERRPLRTDLFEGSDIPTREYLNNGYLQFLNKINELNEEEKTWLGTKAEGFLRELEKMSMTKLYKIPTISCFVDRDKLLHKVSADRIAQNIMDFYKNSLYAPDMQDSESRGYLEWSLQKYRTKAIQMPIKYIYKSSDYFIYDEINKELILDSDIVKAASGLYVEHVKDILEYRLKSKCAKFYKENS